MRRGSRLALLLAGALLASGCAAHWAYRQGKAEAKKGNWDLAVARLTKALQKDPDNIGYRIALENARIQASRKHETEARKALAADDLARAAEEFEIATRYDPGNKAAGDELESVRDRIRKREEERRRLADFEQAKSRARSVQLPVPVLSPRSTAPIIFNFKQQSLDSVFEALGKVAGVNVLFDESFRGERRVDVRLSGVTFQEALDQLTLQNRAFYKVLDQNTIIIVPESAAKRRAYDDLFLRTFYIENAEVKEIETLVKTALGGQVTVVTNPTLGAINVIATPDQIAVAERLIENNDKARGEVLVEVSILEVNRTRVKEYGIELSNYTASATLSPTGADGEVTDAGLTNLRAHLLSSLNVSDFIISIPASILTKFLQTDDSVRILASPKLRAAEGKRTSLKIGTEVPVPVTTFTSAAPGQVGGATFAPATSFQYRNVGVSLDLTPKVSAGGDIFLELAAEFSLLGQPTSLAGSSLPTFLTRNVNGVLRLHDGEPVLLGGLLQERETEGLRGVLGLQSIPILNKVLTSGKREREQTEILISITPHLVRAPRVLEADLQSMAVGTKEHYSVESARPPLFGPAEEESPAPPAGAGTPAPEAPLPSPEAAAPAPEAPAVVEPPPGPAAASEPGPPPVGPALVAQLSPPSATVAAGQTTALSVILVNAQGVQDVELTLRYDPLVVQATDVSPGTLLTLDGAAVGVERSLEPGSVRVRLTRQAPVSGSGIAAVVTFRGVSAGSATVSVESLTLTSAAGAVPARGAAPSRLTVTAAQ